MVQTERLDGVVHEDVLLMKVHHEARRDDAPWQGVHLHTHAPARLLRAGRLQVDVEGFEPVVFSSAKRLFQHHQVDNIVLEYNPGVVEHLPYTAPQLSHLITETPKMLLRLLKEGYRIGMVCGIAGGEGISGGRSKLRLPTSWSQVAAWRALCGRCVQMLDHVAKGRPYGKDSPFPAIPEINASHLAYDLDVRALVEKEGGSGSDAQGS